MMRRSAFALAAALLVSGCASTSANNPKDPFEGYNRAMFAFNDAVDDAVLKPTARAYKTVVPQFVQSGVSNFFGNLSDAWSGVNGLLQGKVKNGVNDFGRFALNSTVGILGLFDVASSAGMPKHNEDFGQTLGQWGVPAGPYLVLPILGPSTVTDTIALPVNWKGDIWTHKEPVRWRNTGTALRIVDKRAGLLDASTLLEDAALDRYEFVRDGFMQRRENLIYDGDVPEKKQDEKAEETKPVTDSTKVKNETD